MSETCPQGGPGDTAPVAGPPLVAIAHGSRDPRWADVAARLADVVRARRPTLDVRLAFLDLSAPRLPDVLSGLRRRRCAGEPCPVVVPLLLGHAYHAGVDVPAAVRRAQAHQPRRELSVADVLGPDPRLAGLARRRLAEAGADTADPDLGVVLAAAGSSDARATAAVAEVAAGWATPAFATAASPGVSEAVTRLRSRGARRVAVASWFLAPGLLPDRVGAAARAADPSAILAAPLGADPLVADVVLDRYDAAVQLAARTSGYRSA